MEPQLSDSDVNSLKRHLQRPTAIKQVTSGTMECGTNLVRFEMPFKFDVREQCSNVFALGKHVYSHRVFM